MFCPCAVCVYFLNACVGARSWKQRGRWPSVCHNFAFEHVGGNCKWSPVKSIFIVECRPSEMSLMYNEHKGPASFVCLSGACHSEQCPTDITCSEGG